MFTGIIRHLGTVEHIARVQSAATLIIASNLAVELQAGDSIAVNGVCLTVLTSTAHTFTIRLMGTTLELTNLGRLAQGAAVNLELPVAAGQRFDGHFVLGHADGTTNITAIEHVGEDKIFTFKPPARLQPYVISKGSVSLDGVSLTVVETFPDTFTVSMMPYTLKNTTFGNVHKGAMVNIEVDVLGKYVERFLDHWHRRSR